MSNLEVKDQESVKNLLEHEFFFVSGMSMPVLLDLDAGDVIVEKSDSFTIDLVAKPSFGDMEVMLSPEHITIYKSQLAAVHVKTRKIRQATAEEKFAFVEALQKVSDVKH